MINLIDFTNNPLSSRNLQYAGRAGEKRGILFNGEYWFLKFPKNTIGMDKVKGISYVTSPLSEYIGSQIFSILGFSVHDTKLGIYNDGKRIKVVCACKDFIKDDKNEILIPYTALRNDTNEVLMDRFSDKIKDASNLNEIIFQLENNTILKSLEGVKTHFWEVTLVDYLINNNDRNEDNWGVIKFKNENKYLMAPIYDCGNCFYGKTSEERIKLILEDKEKIVSSALNITTAYEDDDGNPIVGAKLININNENLKEAKRKICKLSLDKMDEISKMINDIPNTFNGVEIMSELKKKYYIETLKLRINALTRSLDNN